MNRIRCLNSSCLLLLLAVFTVSPAAVLGDNYNSHNRDYRARSYCEDLSPQQFIEMDHIMGIWYGAEVITHQDGPHMEQIYDTCVVLHLAEVTDDHTSSDPYMSRDREHGYQNNHYNNNNRFLRDQLRYLQLTWDERGASLEYLLKFNYTRTGHWESARPQKGQLSDRNYKQFTGTVQVMKAVGNHLVLTFCQTAPNNQMFSIILSRRRNMLTYDEIQSIKKMLNYRNLPISSVRRVCLNGAASLYNSKTGILLLFAALYGILRTIGDRKH